MFRINTKDDEKRFGMILYVIQKKSNGKSGVVWRLNFPWSSIFSNSHEPHTDTGHRLQKKTQ